MKKEVRMWNKKTTDWEKVPDSELHLHEDSMLMLDAAMDYEGEAKISGVGRCTTVEHYFNLQRAEFMRFYFLDKEEE